MAALFKASGKALVLRPFSLSRINTGSPETNLAPHMASPKAAYNAEALKNAMPMPESLFDRCGVKSTNAVSSIQLSLPNPGINDCPDAGL